MRLLYSLRTRILCSVLLLISTLLAMGGSIAQDRSTATTAVGQPTLIISTSKVEQLMASVTYLLRAVNQPEIGGMATMFVNNFSRGLDRSRPMGVAVSMNAAGNPEPIVMLPVSDLKAFFAGLVTFGEPEELSNGLYTMAIRGQVPVFAKQVNNWLIIAQQEATAKEFNQVPSDLLQSLSSRYDVGVKLDVQSVPAEKRDLFISEMIGSYQRSSAGEKARVERELQKAEAAATTDQERDVIHGRREGMKVAEQIQTAQIEQFADMIKNTKQIVIGLLSDSAKKQVYLELASEFIAGSKLDAQIARSMNAKTDLAGIQSEGQALSLSFTDIIDPSQIPQLEQTVSAGIDTMLMATKSSKTDPGIAETIKEVKQVIIKSIQEGIVDGAASVTFQSGLNIVTASRVADGKQLAASLQKAAAAMKPGESTPQIKFNAYTHQGVAIHLGSVKLPNDADDVARKIFSDTASFAVGTADKAVYVAIGSQAEVNLKAAIDRGVGKLSSPGVPMDLKLDVGPLLDYIQTIQPSPLLDAMIQAAQNYSNSDMLTIKSQLVPHGGVMRITIEEGILRAMGAGAKAGQGNRRGGGF